MSRTYRNIRYRQQWSSNIDWVLKDSTNDIDEIPWDEVDKVVISSGAWWCTSVWYNYWYKKNSKEGKRRLARYFSDNGTSKCKEPGPSWYRNLHCTRPYRRKVKNELRKFLLDEEYEIDYTEPYKPYWT